MKKIAIIGAGHLGQQIAHHIANDSKDYIAGFFDDYQVKDNSIMSYPILGTVSEINELYNARIFDEIIIGIGYNHLAFRKKIFEKLDGIIPFYTLIHSSAYIDPSAKIGKGSIIYPRSVVDQNVEIGKNILINISCSIAHDTIIGNHSFLSPSVAIAGFSNIGEQCFIGINSTIKDNINITARTQIGAGSVVIKNITESGWYIGNPAKFLKSL